MGTKKIEGKFAPNAPPRVNVELRAADGSGPPVTGPALIDTAADFSCIHEDVARRLGLEKLSEVPVRGSTGSAHRAVFRCAIDVVDFDPVGPWPVTSVSRDLQGFVLLVGRDLMLRWVTNFYGPKRRYWIRKPAVSATREGKRSR